MSGYGGGGQSQSQAVDKTPSAYKKRRGFVARELESQVKGNVRGLEGPFVAGLGEDELSALSQFRDNAFGPNGLGAAADAQLRSTLEGKENPFLPQAIDAAITPILRNAELQELRDRALFTGAGQKIQGSSSFSEDRARSITETERNVGDVASQLAFQAYQQERQHQMEAVSLTNARFAEQREGIAALALPRLIEQLGIDRGNAELQRRFKVMENALALLADLTRPTVAVESDSIQTQGGGGIGPTGGGGGGGTSGGE